MAENLSIREGTTNAIQMKLLSNGEPIDLSGAYVTLKMLDSKKQVYSYVSTTSTDVIIVQINSGVVNFVPPSSTVFLYQHSPYYLYCWVNTTSSQKFSVPESDTVVINVLRDY